MPTNKVSVKERTVRRLIRAGQKEGLIAKSVSYSPDGTVTVSLAEPSSREVSIDTPELSENLSREIDEMLGGSEWDEKYGKGKA